MSAAATSPAASSLLRRKCWPDAPAEAREVIGARWRYQQEIESTQRELYKVRGQLAGDDQIGIVEGLMWEVLGLVGFKRPKRKQS